MIRSILLSLALLAIMPSDVQSLRHPIKHVKDTIAQSLRQTINQAINQPINDATCGLDPLHPYLAHTPLGDVQGTASERFNVRSFYQIPFAHPPINDLRFVPPQNISQFPGYPSTYQATEPTTRLCIQPATRNPLSNQSNNQPGEQQYVGSEDCLYLDIIAPGPSTPIPAGGFPVLFYICGGPSDQSKTSSNNQSNNQSDDYESIDQCDYQNATSWVSFSQSFIYVSVSYRLSVFGYFALPELSAETSPISYSGNQGFLDQIAALTFVNRYINCFGGDPRAITLHGQGSGAQSVCLHLVSSKSKGMFHKAILHSPGCDQSINTLDQQEQSVGNQLVQLSPCKDSNRTNVVSCLRSLSSDQLINLVEDLPLEPYVGFSSFRPVIDGFSIVEPPVVTFSLGHQARVPLFLGSTTGETISWLFTRGPPSNSYNYTWSDVDSNILYFDRDNITLASWYGSRYGDDVADAYIDSTSEYRYVCPTRRVALAGARAGVNVFHYVWDYLQPSGFTAYGWLNRTRDGSELSIIFNHSETYSAHQDMILSAEIQNLLLRFIVTSSPNADIPADELYQSIYGENTSLPVWPSYTNEQRQSIYVNYTEDGSFINQFHIVSHAVRDDICDLWDGVIPQPVVKPRYTQCLNNECSSHENPNNQCVDLFNSTYVCECDVHDGWLPNSNMTTCLAPVRPSSSSSTGSLSSSSSSSYSSSSSSSSSSSTGSELPAADQAGFCTSTGCIVGVTMAVVLGIGFFVLIARLCYQSRKAPKPTNRQIRVPAATPRETRGQMPPIMPSAAIGTHLILPPSIQTNVMIAPIHSDAAIYSPNLSPYSTTHRSLAGPVQLPSSVRNEPTVSVKKKKRSNRNSQFDGTGRERLLNERDHV